MKIDKKRVFGCLHACLKQEDNAIRIRTPAIDSSFLRSKKKNWRKYFLFGTARRVYFGGARKERKLEMEEQKERKKYKSV
jgi:hypothetical protein